MNIRYLNIGGGNFCHRENEWVNLDYPFEAYKSKRSPWRMDIFHNLMLDISLPIESDSVESVYTSHTIEHLTEEAVIRMFKEVKRILVPRGAFRIAVPNSELFFQFMKNPEIDDEKIATLWFGHNIGYSKERTFLDEVCSHLMGKLSDAEVREIINKHETRESCFNELYEIADKRFGIKFTSELQSKTPAYHISWWDHKKLKEHLKIAGFKKISEPLKRNESEYEAFHAKYIDRTVPHLSLRVEAIKTQKPQRSLS